MRTKALLLAGSVLAVSLVTACGPADGSGTTAGTSHAGSDTAQSDVRPTVAPKAGDCVGVAVTFDQVWVASCANRNAVAKVSRQVPHGDSDQCSTDDYVGFDFGDADKPTVCLMLYGTVGDCYSGFNKKIPTGPRVDCTDPKATLRLVQILDGDTRDRCAQLTRPNDPNQSSLFYRTGSADVTYCLGSAK